MDAKEFRFGNLVYSIGIDYVDGNAVPDRSDIDVVTVDLEVLSNIINFNNTEDYALYEPIQINQEWLRKLGFDMKSDFTYHSQIDLDISHYLTFIEKENLIIIECDDCNYNIKLDHIKYVHQLQNIYYYLMGFEIEYSL